MPETLNLEGLLKIFTFNKKKELERHCRSLLVSGNDFVSLILSCEQPADPIIHQISFQDIVPVHLEPPNSEMKALTDNGLGELGPEAAKAVRKMGQMFEERRYLVGHIFLHRIFPSGISSVLTSAISRTSGKRAPTFTS